MNERMNTTEVFDGIRFPGFMHTPESLKMACSFQFQDTDVLLVTFPKSGEGLGEGAWTIPHKATFCRRASFSFWAL